MTGNYDSWMNNIGKNVKFIDKDEWYVMLALLKGLQKMIDITSTFGDESREEISAVCDFMLKNGVITKCGQMYELEPSIKKHYGESLQMMDIHNNFKCMDQYANHDSSTCIKCVVIRNLKECVAKCVKYHFSKKHFVAVANQEFKKGGECVDMVAYDYEKQESIAIEIKSDIEVKSHPEHIAKDMVKWSELHFDRYEVWSMNCSIVDIYFEQMKKEVQKKKLGNENKCDILENVTICH